MKTPNDTIYLLSVTKNIYDDGNLYITKPGFHEGAFDISMSIKDARVFYSRQDTQNFRKAIGRPEWKVTPITAKKLFTRKLKIA